MRKLATVTAPTPPFGLSSLGKSADCATRRMVQAALSVTLHMPEATSRAASCDRFAARLRLGLPSLRSAHLRSAHTRPLKFDIMLPLPQVQVEALDVRLLARAVRVAVEHPHAARQEPVRVVLWVGTVVLDHLGVAELGAVVRHDAAEEPSEQFRPRGLPEHVDDAREGLRRLRVPEIRLRGQTPRTVRPLPGLPWRRRC